MKTSTRGWLVVALLFCFTSAVSAADPVTSWTTTLSTPEPVVFGGVAEYNGHLIVLNSFTGSTLIGDLCSNGSVSAWRYGLRHPNPTFYFGHRLARVNRFLVLPAVGSSWLGELAPNGDVVRWFTGPGTVNPDDHGRATVTNGQRIYSIGGKKGFALFTHVETAIIDGSGDLSTWIELNALPFAIHDPMATIIGSHLYVFGGESDAGGGLFESRSVLRAPINDDGAIGMWERAGSLLIERPHSTFIRLGNTIHVIGAGVHGYITGHVESVAAVSLGVTAEHQVSAPLPVPLSAAAGVSARDRAYVIGGDSRTFGGQPQNTVYVFPPIVEEPLPPTISAPRDITISADSLSCKATVSELGEPLVTGGCGAVTVNRSGIPLDGTFPLGTTDITWTATDQAGNFSTAIQRVTVTDDEPPTVFGVALSPAILWPPNHEMVSVSVNYSTADRCSPTSSTIEVTSNEPANGLGDGDSAPDWQVLDGHSVMLRAERSGTGNGRVYTVTIRTVDSSGNITTANAAVTVPKSQN